jgi:hypothetical protein
VPDRDQGVFGAVPEIGVYAVLDGRAGLGSSREGIEGVRNAFERSRNA